MLTYVTRKIRKVLVPHSVCYSRFLFLDLDCQSSEPTTHVLAESSLFIKMDSAHTDFQLTGTEHLTPWVIHSWRLDLFFSDRERPLFSLLASSVLLIICGKGRYHQTCI